MSKAVKEMMTEELTSFFEDMGDCLVVNYQGLPVPETDEVRATLRQAGLKMKMVNNAMAGRALDRVGLADVSKLLDGPSAFLVGGDGPVEAAKVFTDLMKKRPALQLRGAWVEGALLDAEQVKDLAKIPPREVLISQIMAGIQGPLAGLAGVLSGVHRQLTMVVKAVAEQKGGGQEAEAADAS